MNDLTPVLVELGREESRDLMNGIKEDLTVLQDDIDEDDFDARVAELFMRAHTLKGTSRTIGFEEVEDTAANLERFLRRIRHPEFAGALDGAVLSEGIADLLERLDRALRYIEQDRL